MKTIAKYRYAKSSPQKVRLVTNLIKGKKALKAINILNYINKKAAILVKKVLYSAIANAENNNGSKSDFLKIDKIFVDEGPRIKRIIPRAKGRTNRILKRTSHITIILCDN